MIANLDSKLVSVLHDNQSITFGLSSLLEKSHLHLNWKEIICNLSIFYKLRCNFIAIKPESIINSKAKL